LAAKLQVFNGTGAGVHLRRNGGVMTKRLIIGLGLAFTTLALSAKEPLTIAREKLPDGSSPTATIEGQVSESGARVWVVVHPRATNVCWVQPEASVYKNTWTATVHLGEQNDKDTFEIRAIANPATEMKTGMQIPCWPKAQLMSEIVQVTRK
jgi:hypothetical protein